VGDITIRGRAEFLLRTQESLALLKRSPQFAVIQSNLAIIRQGRRSGMKAWAKLPTFIVGRRTWEHSALWYAGAIAHDAFHAKLYFDAKRENPGRGPDADAWTGAEAEKQCLAFQREALIALEADAKTIAYIDECAKNPTYQGHNRSWRSWLDYLKRWW
jgi:hypothetical protein